MYIYLLHAILKLYQHTRTNCIALSMNSQSKKLFKTKLIAHLIESYWIFLSFLFAHCWCCCFVYLPTLELIVIFPLWPSVDTYLLIIIEWVLDMINLSFISSILYIHFCNFNFIFESIPPKCTNKVVVFNWICPN